MCSRVVADYLPKKAGFLVLARPNGKAHVWLGEDTACRMWSTGGLTGRYEYAIDRGGRPVCRNCLGALGCQPRCY